MYSLIFYLVLVTAEGPKEINWVIPGLSAVACEFLALNANVGGTIPATDVIDSGAMCVSAEPNKPTEKGI